MKNSNKLPDFQHQMARSMNELNLGGTHQTSRINSTNGVRSPSPLHIEVNDLNEEKVAWVPHETETTIKEFEWEEDYPSGTAEPGGLHQPDNHESARLAIPLDEQFTRRRQASGESKVSSARCSSPFSGGAAYRIHAVATAIKAFADTSESTTLEVTVSESLGGKSRAFKDAHFSDGGGCIIKYKQTIPFSAKDQQEAFDNKLKRWEKYNLTQLSKNPQGKKTKKPENKPLNKTITREIELHPAGGMHSGYQNHATHRGSYVRITNNEGPSFRPPDSPIEKESPKQEERFGRHGHFPSNQTVNRKNLQSYKPADEFLPNLVAPKMPDDGAPEPALAQKILDALFVGDKAKVEAILNVLSDDNLSWREMDEAIEGIRNPE